MMTRKALIKRLSLLLFIMGSFLLIWLWFNTATIAITSSPGAELYIRQNGSDFKKIGTGEATFRTRSAATVFIEARKEEAVTQKSVSPKKRKKIIVSLNLRPVVGAERVAQGPITYPHIEDGFVFGINPNTRSLMARPVAGNQSQPPILSLLPYLNQIVWFNKDNFIFVTQGRGAGAVTNPPHHDPEQGLPFIAASAVNSDTVALLGYDGLYITTGVDIGEARKIAPHIHNSAPFLFADQNYIFFGGHIFEPADHEDKEPDIEKTELILFDQYGKELQKGTLPIYEKIHNIVRVNGNTLAILTESNLVLLDLRTNETSVVAFSFGRVEDMLTHNGRLLLLGSSGLWEYITDNDEYYKLASYPPEEEYTPNSLSEFNNNLYFSSSISREALNKNDSGAASSFYRVKLEQL